MRYKRIHLAILTQKWSLLEFNEKCCKDMRWVGWRPSVALNYLDGKIHILFHQKRQNYHMLNKAIKPSSRIRLLRKYLFCQRQTIWFLLKITYWIQKNLHTSTIEILLKWVEHILSITNLFCSRRQSNCSIML